MMSISLRNLPDKAQADTELLTQLHIDLPVCSATTYVVKIRIEGCNTSILLNKMITLGGARLYSISTNMSTSTLVLSILNITLNNPAQLVIPFSFNINDPITNTITLTASIGNDSICREILITEPDPYCNV